jgi:hypothetical protein
VPVIAAPAYWQHLGFRRHEPFVPFEAQAELFEAIKLPWPGLNKRTKRPYPRTFTGRCGRRFGKTTIGEKLLWGGMMAPDDRQGPPTVRVTADTEEHGMKIWRPFINHLENTDLVGLLKDYSREYQRVEFINGATAQLYSAHNPAALSGDGATLWIIDEAQFLSGEAMDNLFPSVSDRHGVIAMFGVAQGEGPFKELSYKGQDADIPEVKDMRFPTSANPYIDPWDIEYARRVTYAGRPNVFKQLYEAEWVGELGKIFVGVRDCIKPAPITQHPLGFSFTEPAQRGHLYYGGLDLARLQDWTVYTIWDRSGRLVAWDRFNLVSWKSLQERLTRMSAAYGHPLTTVDSTGIGDPLFEGLLNMGMNVVEYKIVSNEAKRRLIDELSSRIALNEVRFPDWKDLISELERMEAKKASEQSMVIRYEAPSGSHDDCVISAALAFQNIPHVTHAPVRPDPVMSDPMDAIIDEASRQSSAYEFV